MKHKRKKREEIERKKENKKKNKCVQNKSSFMLGNYDLRFGCDGLKRYICDGVKC